MRRTELATQDESLFRELAADVLAGYLGLVTAAGTPRVITLNFAALGHDIYFHGALAGEKYDLLRESPPAGFTFVKEYSYIPSHWSVPDYACPATQFFKSVEIKGRGEVVADPVEKARALQAMMEKHQPEGRYQPIEPTDRRYAKALAHVGVYCVRCASWTGKRKFGQNEPLKLRRNFVLELRKRGGPLDEATACEIESDFKD